MTRPRPSAGTAWRAVRRAVLGRRRLLAALSTAVAVAAALHSVAGPPPPAVPVVTTARDVPAGSVLRAADLRVVGLPPETVPHGVLATDELIGRTTAGPLRAGEPVTDVAVVQRSLLAGYPGLVAAPVRLDPAAVSLLRVGDRIDLVATDAQGLRATVVARSAVVLALPRVEDKAAFSDSAASIGRLIIVAIPEETAVHVAQAGVSSFISMVLNR